MKVTFPFGEWRPDVARLDNEFASIAENVYAGANSYLPFPGLTAPSNVDITGGNDTYTKILLHFTGTDGGTTITDDNAGGSAHTWTAAGNANTDNAQAKFGTTSLSCDGTGDWVSTTDHADFTLGSGAFTVDFWVRPAVDGSRIQIAGQGDATSTAAATSIHIERNASNKIEASVSNGSGLVSLTSTTSIIAGAWYHIAFVRTGNTMNLYVNGTLEATTSNGGTAPDSGNAWAVGRIGESTAGVPWNGWIDEFRLSVGIARWIDNFTPPTGPYFAGGTACGLTYAHLADDSFAIYAGTPTKLLKWSGSWWNDVSRTSGGNYAVPAGDRWVFQQSGTKLVAVNSADDVQSIDVDSGSNFAALSGSPPDAGYVSQIGDFLVLSRLTTDKKIIQWSAINSITGWTVGTNLSDQQTFPDGNDVQGVAGGEIGYVVQENAIRIMQFLPGDTTDIFRFSKVLDGKGCVSKYGFTTVNNVLYFVAEDGFYNLAGAQLTPIGEDKVNEWFLNNSDPARRNVVQAFTYPNKSIVGWAFHTSAASATYDKLILFHWAKSRWTYATVAGQVWSGAVSTGVTLDTSTADPADALLDSAAPSLDSYAYTGGRPLVAAISPNGLLSFLAGPNLAAVMETVEMHPIPGMRAFVNDAYPLVDASTVKVAVGTRERLQDSVSWGAATPLETTGAASVLASGRLHRCRVTIDAADPWTHAQGVMLDAQPDGMA